MLVMASWFVGGPPPSLWQFSLKAAILGRNHCCLSGGAGGGGVCEFSVIFARKSSKDPRRAGPWLLGFVTFVLHLSLAASAGDAARPDCHRGLREALSSLGSAHALRLFRARLVQQPPRPSLPVCQPPLLLGHCCYHDGRVPFRRRHWLVECWCVLLRCDHHEPPFGVLLFIAVLKETRRCLLSSSTWSRSRVPRELLVRALPARTFVARCCVAQVVHGATRLWF